VAGGCNYNVCCPGTDHLVGSYVKEAVWRPRVKKGAPQPSAGDAWAAEMITLKETLSNGGRNNGASPQPAL
jgi:hypothetical protein